MNHPENLRWGYANPYLRKFLQTAYAEGLEKVDRPGSYSTESWQRTVQIGEDFLGCDLFLEEFGQVIGITKERVRQQVFSYVNGLYHKGDSSLRLMFPWEILKKTLRKPMISLRFEKCSRAKGGKGVEFVELLNAGASLVTAQELSGASNQLIQKVRERQDILGIQVPYSESPNRLDGLVADLGKFDDYETVGYLLALVDHSYIVCRGNHVVHLSDVVAAAGFFGFNRHSRPFIESLQHVTLPVQQVSRAPQTRGNKKYDAREFVISARHFEEAKQILLLDDTLKDYLVKKAQK